MQQIEYLEEIAGKLEKKYTGFVEIYRLTKELDDLLKNNDRDSVNMIMKMRGEEMDISAADSKVKILVVPTDEEMTIAKDTYDICCK